jgi:catechol-2,3-dioxygenase
MLNLSIQMNLCNVSNLERSVEFYVAVYELRVVSRQDQVAALVVSEAERTQTLVLRQVPDIRGVHGGRWAIGPRFIAFEASSLEELELVSQRLSERQALAGRTRTDAWEAILGYDPDRIEVALAVGLTGSPIRSEDWHQLPDIVYQIGE